MCNIVIFKRCNALFSNAIHFSYFFFPCFSHHKHPGELTSRYFQYSTLCDCLFYFEIACWNIKTIIFQTKCARYKAK